MLCGIGGSEEKQLVMSGNLNVRQATSQQVFKVTTFCMVQASCLNQLHHPTHAPASCPRFGNLPDLDQDCWLASR